MNVAGLTITNDRVDKYHPDLQYSKIIITGPGSDGTKVGFIIHVLSEVICVFKCFLATPCFKSRSLGWMVRKRP